MSASYNFDRFIDRRNTASLKWNRYAGLDILPMWVADMDFQSPQEVLEALHHRVDHGVFGYSEAPEELVRTVQSHLSRRYDWQVDPDWILWLPGLVTGINVVCRGIGKPGDSVMTTVPVYPPFLSAPGHFDKTRITVPLRPEGSWTPDPDQMEALVRPDTRLFLFCNPHNPTGRVYNRQELIDLAEFCMRHDMVICSDEIHCDLILEPALRHIPLAAISPEIASRSITLMAPSKTYNLPGLACSFAVIPNPSLRNRILEAMAGLVPRVNILGYTAATAAYRYGADWLEALLDYLRGNRKRVEEAVIEMPGIKFIAPQATYLAWLDARATGLQDPAAHFESFGVGLSDGRDFGSPGWVRFNFGCPRALLETALERMHRSLS